MATKGTDAPNTIDGGSRSLCGTVTVGGEEGAITDSPYTYEPNRKVLEMKRKRYERTELEIIKFLTEDAILTSGFEYEEDETPLIPHKP